MPNEVTKTPIAHPYGRGMGVCSEFEWQLRCSRFLSVALYRILCYIRPRYTESIVYHYFVISIIHLRFNLTGSQSPIFVQKTLLYNSSCSMYVSLMCMTAKLFLNEVFHIRVAVIAHFIVIFII